MYILNVKYPIFFLLLSELLFFYTEETNIDDIISNRFDLYIYPKSSTELYFSDYKVNYIIDINSKIVTGSYFDHINYSGGNFLPLTMIDNNKKPVAIVNFYGITIDGVYNTLISTYNLKTKQEISFVLPFTLGSLFLKFNQFDQNRFIMSYCETPRIYVYLFNMDGTFIFQKYSTTISCSRSIDSIAVNSSTFFLVLHNTYDAQTRRIIWKVNENIQEESYSDISLMRNTDSGFCYFTHLSESTIMYCCCVNDCSTIKCNQYDLFPNELVYELSPALLNQCNMYYPYDKNFVVKTLYKDYVIVACVGENTNPIYKINVYKTNSSSSSIIHYYLKNSIVIPNNNKIYCELTVISDLKIILVCVDIIGSDTYKYNYELISFCFNREGEDLPIQEKHYSYYLKSSDNLFYDCPNPYCKNCIEENGSPKCIKCYPEYFLYVDIENKCTKKGEEGSSYILDPVILKYQTCSLNYYMKDDQFFCSECNSEYPYLIESERRCVDNCVNYGLYLYLNQCVTQCPPNTYLVSKSECVVFQNDNGNPRIIDNTKDEIFDSLEDNISYLLSLSTSSIIGNGFSLTTYPFSLSSFIEMSTLTSIDLAESESILRSFYDLGDTEIYIAKIEYYNESSIIPGLKYNIYDSEGNLLDLSICMNTGISVSFSILDEVKANLTFSKNMKEEIGVDVYNKNDRFFTDICYPFSINDSDVVLEDRQNDFYQNIQLCEEGCKYKGINYETKRSICQCTIIIDENEREETSLFNNVYYATNIPLFKCFSLVFKWKNLKNNISFYFIGGIYILELTTFIIFTLDSPFENILKHLVKEFDNPNGERKKTDKTSNSETSTSKIMANETDKEFKNKDKNINQELIKINDDDLNNCIYRKAKKKEKRNVLKFFFDLLLIKIELINIFWSYSNMELFLLSISIYLLSLASDFFMNGLLFTDEVISQRYHNDEISFLTTFVLTVLSNIASFIIVFFISKLSNFSVIDIIEENSNTFTKLLKLFGKVITFVKVKLYIYFIVVLILIPIYLYFLCIFCIVYHSSQWNWFSNSFVSVGLSVLYSLGNTFIITFFRFLGLYFKSEKTYNISLYLNRE